MIARLKIYLPLIILTVAIVVGSFLADATDGTGKVIVDGAPITVTPRDAAIVSAQITQPTTTTTLAASGQSDADHEAPPARVTASTVPVVSEGDAPPVTIEPWQMSDVETIVCGVFGENCARALQVARCESGLTPTAVSPTNDHGLFQLHKDAQRISDVAWWDETLGLGLGWDAIYDPYVNSVLAYSQSNGGTDFSSWTCG